MLKEVVNGLTEGKSIVTYVLEKEREKDVCTYCDGCVLKAKGHSRTLRKAQDQREVICQQTERISRLLDI